MKAETVEFDYQAVVRYRLHAVAVETCYNQVWWYTRMDENVEHFGQLLFRNDRGAVDDLRSALSDWLPFYEQHGRDIGVDVPWLKKLWAKGPWPWDVLIDIGVLHKYIFEADHSEFIDEVSSAVSQLVPAKTLQVNWTELAAKHANGEIEALFADLAVRAKTSNEVLVILDKGSDSYPLAFLSQDSVARAQELAKLIGGGEVIIAGQRE